METNDICREHSLGALACAFGMEGHNGTGTRNRSYVASERGHDPQDCTENKGLAKKATLGSTFARADAFETSMNAVSKLLDHTVSGLRVDEREMFDAELMRIPDDEKKEYLEALEAASSFVIEKEANPAMFVLIENQQYDRAARRMVDYWKNRKEMFGSRAFKSVFDLSGNGALTLNELGPFRRSLEHVILPSDAMGRTVLYFDDEYLDSSYYRDAYSDTRQRILFLLLNFAALTNMPISQKEGIVTLRVIRRENYDLTKAVKHGSLLSFMPLISHSIQFCGIPPKGARRYFKDYLMPLLVGSSENEGDRPKEKMTNALAPFPILTKFHMSSKHRSIASKLEECDLRRTGIPVSLGGGWSNTVSRLNVSCSDASKITELRDVLSVWSSIIQTLSGGILENVIWSGHVESEDTEAHDHKRKAEAGTLDSSKRAINSGTVNMSQRCCNWSPKNSIDNDQGQFQGKFNVSSSEIEQIDEECKQPSVSYAGFKLLSKEANEAIMLQRKHRKRQMDVIYARHRRSRDRCEVMILQERVAFIAQSNRDLNNENCALAKLLTAAQAIVARSELESNMVNSRMLVPGNASMLVSERDVLSSNLIHPNLRDVAIDVSNLSPSFFPTSDFQGILPSIASVESHYLNPHGPNFIGQLSDMGVVQHLLEQARNIETVQRSRHEWILAQVLNASAMHVANMNHTPLMLPTSPLCHVPASLLSQALVMQPCSPESSGFQRPATMFEDANAVSPRLNKDLLDLLHFLAGRRRM